MTVVLGELGKFLLGGKGLKGEGTSEDLRFVASEVAVPWSTRVRSDPSLGISWVTQIWDPAPMATMAITAPPPTRTSREGFDPLGAYHIPDGGLRRGNRGTPYLFLLMPPWRRKPKVKIKYGVPGIPPDVEEEKMGNGPISARHRQSSDGV